MSAQDRQQYLAGCHPGSDVWRHERTSETPAYPTWRAEGSPCRGDLSLNADGERVWSGCPGRRTTYKSGREDTGVACADDFAECGTPASPDAHVGDWICDGPRRGGTVYHLGMIALSEVKEHRNHEPPADGGALPLFGSA